MKGVRDLSTRPQCSCLFETNWWTGPINLKYWLYLRYHGRMDTPWSLITEKMCLYWTVGFPLSRSSCIRAGNRTNRVGGTLKCQSYHRILNFSFVAWWHNATSYRWKLYLIVNNYHTLYLFVHKIKKKQSITKVSKSFWLRNLETAFLENSFRQAK